MSETAGVEPLEAFINIALPLLATLAAVPSLLMNGIDKLAGFATVWFPSNFALIPLFVLLLAKGMIYTTLPSALFFILYVLWSKFAHRTIHALSGALSRNGDPLYFDACRVAHEILNPLYLHFVAFAFVGGWALEYRNQRPLTLSGALESMCGCVALLFVAMCFVAVCVPIIRAIPLERMMPAYFPSAEPDNTDPVDKAKDTDSDTDGESEDHHNVACFNCRVEARVSETLEEAITDVGDMVIETCEARTRRNTVLTLGDVRRAVNAAVEEVTEMYV